jgi:hypothetical protein
VNEQEKQLVRNVQSHDLAESLRLRRAVHAKTQGLPPESFALPFPANQVTIQRGDAGGLWWKVPLGVATGVIALSLPAIAALGVWLAVNRPSPTPAVVAEPAKPPPVTQPGGWQWQIEYKDRDGNWKPVGDAVRIHPKDAEVK